MNFIPRLYTPSGSLTEGVPAASYSPGHYAFRTSILYLGMEPVTNGDEAFRAAFNQNFYAATGGDYAASAQMSVGAPFQQSVPMTDRQAFVAYMTWLAEMSLVGVTPTSLGMAVAANLQTVKAQWLTISCALHAPRGFNLDSLNRAVAAAVGATVRLRHWERGDIIVPAPADSVLARTREPNACAGARLLSNVTAAACTRVQYTGAWTAPAAPQVIPPAAQPTRTPQPAATQQSAAPVYYPPPASPEETPWGWYAAGALLVTGAAVLIITNE